MASNGYYDKNKDYSLEIKKAQDRGASQAEINRLRQERQNKIDSQYGGRDPYQGASDIMGTRHVESIWKEDPKVHYAPGVARPPVRNTTMVGGPEYAGKRVALGDWTYIFNDKGRQIGRVKDYGASANGVIHTTHADDSPAHRAAYDAAARGDWDAVGHWLNEISKHGGTDEHGNYDMTQANRYNQELQLEFPSIKNYYRNKYDSVYGKGAWDDPNHTYGNQVIDPVYKELAEQNPQGLPMQRPAGTVPGFRPGSGWRPGGVPGIPAIDRAEETLQELYRRRAEAEQARLKAMYQAQAGGLQAHDDLLDRLYMDKRNQAAAQNELERLRMMEMGLAHGLNTGTAGQLAAGQSSALQGVLGGLSRQEAADRAENQRRLNDLWNKYLAEVEASNARQAELYYQELRREQERLQREEEARLRREDALAQDRRDQERWEQEWAAEQAAEKWKQDLKRAELMAKWGDFSGYRELGMM